MRSKHSGGDWEEVSPGMYKKKGESKTVYDKRSMGQRIADLMGGYGQRKKMLDRMEKKAGTKK